jgi:hypothetical protein
MVFTIANELVNHYSKKLDREVIDEITSNLTLEMCQGPTSWAFSGKDQPGTCQQPQPDVVMTVEFDRVTAERDALQQRLNAADQLISEQRVALTRIHDRAHAFAEDECIMRVASVEVIRDIAARALGMDGKPPTYKPGLYAVRHIDNWDGERDVALTFAMLDADGKWTEKETGEPLLTYSGDKVLTAWPLDCPDAPDTQIIGVPRNWLEDWALELVEAAQDGGQMSNQVEHLLEIHAKP